jgi:multiple sugar transport system substrate-binding protein
MYSQSAVRRIAAAGVACPTLCLIGIAALSACASATPTPPGPATISLAPPDRSAEQTEYYFLIEGFHEAHPHITVELLDSAYGADVYQTRSSGSVQVSIEWSGPLVDVALERPPLSLDPLIARDRSLEVDDFYPGMMEALASDGETLALPASADILVMYYNLDLYDESGVAYPQPGWTWDDFLDRAAALRDRDAGVFGYVGLGGLLYQEEDFAVYDPALDAIAFIRQNGGRLADDSGRPTLDDPLVVQAVDWYAELTTYYGVAPTPQEARETFLCDEERETTQSCSMEGVAQGRVAMWAGWLSQRGGYGSWRRGQSWPERWGIVALPSGRRAASIARVNGFSISSEAIEVEACWDLVEFLSRQLSWRYIPARRSLAESGAYADQVMVDRDLADLARDSMESAVVLSDSETRWSSLLTEAVYRVLSGSATAEEALTDAQLQAEADLGRTQ